MQAHMTVAVSTSLADEFMRSFELHHIALASLAEKFLPIIPSYALFPAIGMGAADVPDLLLRCVAAMLGSVAGAVGWYGLGASIGPTRVDRVVAKLGPWLSLKPALYERLKRSYARHPILLTIIGQLVPTVRIFNAFPAGALGLPILPFLLATAAGSFCWIVMLALAGFLLRRQGVPPLEIGIGILVAVLAIELATAIILGCSRRYRQR